MANVKAKENLNDQFTMTEPEKDPGYTGPTVSVFLAEQENMDGDGRRVDQYEHVTVANMVKENTDYVRRGEWVDVSVPTFLALKEKYPKI